MSFIESLLGSQRFVVRCQTDDNEKALSSNQCSWCAAVFASKAREFRKLLGRKDDFVSLYNECLLTGSKLRAERGDSRTYSYGENIDNQLISRCVPIEILAQYTILANIDQSFLDILPHELRDEFYKRTYILREDIDFIIGNIVVLVSRHGQSFTVIPLTSESYLVLDSHVHNVGIMSKNSLKKYIFGDGHLHVTCLVCSL